MARIDKEKLQENLFYENVDYILWIPENFAENCIEGRRSFQQKDRGLIPVLMWISRSTSS